MADFRAGTPAQDAFLAELLAAGLFVATGVHGVYGRGGAFEDVRLRFDDLIRRIALVDEPEVLRFPPLIPRRQMEDSGYLKSFPHLAGSVFAFEGGESEAAEQYDRACWHEDWSGHQRQSELVLTPAACYPV